MRQNNPRHPEDGSSRLFEDLEVFEREGELLPAEERVRAAVPPLLFWFRQNARVLPWREEPTPYHVWI